MKALIIDWKISRMAIGMIAGKLFGARGYVTRLGHLQYKDVPNPKLPAEDWVVIKPHYCGICGSDTKQIYLDGNMDNPMTAIISWPQILGHEAVGYVEKVGSKVTKVKVGDRVALNPWISCAPRGFSEEKMCPWCKVGKNTLCRNFKKGILAPGIHTGNSRDATGGFAELVPAHESMAVPIPDEINWEQAVLSDPFSVALHSILKVRPTPGSVSAVFGCGNLGLLTIHILKKVFTDITVIAIARFPHQAEMAKHFGADHILNPWPLNTIITEIANLQHCEIYYPKPKNPWLIEGVDYIFDTVASPETLQTGIRIVKARNQARPGSGTIVVTGVNKPGRIEWTPWYFKEVNIIGSNAFAVETFEDHREHAYQHYYRFLKAGKVDPSQMISHKFPLAQYQDALVATHLQGKYRALKVIFTYGSQTEGSKK